MNKPKRYVYKIRKADADDKDTVQYHIKWRAKWKECFNKLYYSDDLAGPDGIHFGLYVYRNTSDLAIQKALTAAHQDRDIVKYSVLEIPPEWAIEAGAKGFEQAC